MGHGLEGHEMELEESYELSKNDVTVSSTSQAHREQ